MPNLINVLRTAGAEGAKKGMKDEERREAVAAALKRSGDKAQKSGMEWGTCMVFSCEKDCRGGGKGNEEERDVWREEVVNGPVGRVDGDLYIGTSPGSRIFFNGVFFVF